MVVRFVSKICWTSAQEKPACENEFDLQENEPVGEIHFYMNGLHLDSFWHRGKRQLVNGLLILLDCKKHSQVSYALLTLCSCSQGYLEELVEQNFTNYVDTVNREPILFGDYRNALTEDPRLYEDIVDYEAAKAIFDEVGNLLPFPFPLPLNFVINFIFITMP